MNNYKKAIVQEIDFICNISPELMRNTFSSPDKDFTRFRKQSLGSVLKMGLIKAGACLNQQIRLCHGIGGDRPSASAYVQQRDKLTESTYRNLFYTQRNRLPDFSVYKGRYIVVAIDGSDVNIHPNHNDESTICRTYAKKYEEKAKVKPVNQVHLNAAVCVPDGFFIDYEIQDWKDRDERMACSRMMERMVKVYSAKDLLVTCDRGYESYYLMMLADSLGLKYCIRVKDVDSKVGIASRYVNLKGPDGCIDADIDKKYTFCYFVVSRPNEYPDCVYCHSNHYNQFIPKTPNKAKGGGKADGNSKLTYYQFSYRLVRFPIGDNSFETLVTNLSRDEFPLAEMKSLYHMRWGIETAFRQLKYDDCAAFMHSKKKHVAIGEIILSMVFHNICTMVLLLLSEEMQRQSENRVLAYGISYSDLASVLRMFISGRDPTITIRKIVRELLITLQPIRASRAFDRFLINHPFVPFVYRAA